MTRVVSLFSGCGGLDIGFKWSGFDIVWAADNYVEACMTYEKNVGKEITCVDICSVDFDVVPDADVIIGGPPCQAFSLAGKRDPNDKNFALIWEFLRGIKAKMPQAFVMENVPGLRSATDKHGTNVLQALVAGFTRLGYKVTPSLLNAADYGVPQRRKRLFLLGTLGRSAIRPLPNTHTGNAGEAILRDIPMWVSSGDAIGDLPDPQNDDGAMPYGLEPNSDYAGWLRKGSDGIHDHRIPTMSELDRQIISHVSEGGNYMDIPDSIPSQRIRNYKKTGGRTTTYGRLDRKMPAYTINTYFSRPNVGCNIHYSKDRLITIREGLRLQSFTDSFVLPERMSKTSQYKVVGNAVPPIMGLVLAETLKANIPEIAPNRELVAGFHCSSNDAAC